MPLSDIVSVTVTTQAPGVTAAGFGVPLIVSHSATWAERTRTYGGVADVAADFATTTPEYKAAQAIFSQQPAPEQIMIGRAASKPTQTVHVSLAALGPTGTVYKVRIDSQVASYTSVGGDTNDNIIAGLVTAVGALTSPGVAATVTGSSGSHVLVLTASTPGAWHAFEVYDANPGTVGQLELLEYVTADTTGPSLADDLTAIAAESSAWYGLILTQKSAALISAAAAWTEANTKLLAASTSDTKAATQASGVGTDILQTLAAADYARTAAAFHPRNDEFFDAAEMGRFLPIDPGGDNWRMKTLAGVTPASLTGTQITNLNAKNANFFYRLAGANVVGGGGKVAANEYIDVVRFRDWWAARLSERLANLLMQSEKVPYTDHGVALVEAQVRAQNEDGIRAGGISPDPEPTVTAPRVATVSSGDKQARILRNVNTTWELAGAINKLSVNAQILV